jgi:hypothetical protein
MNDYDRFVERWPSLQDWLDAPRCGTGSSTRTTASADSTRTAAPA